MAHCVGARLSDWNAEAMNERELFRRRINTLATVTMMLAGSMILGLVVKLLLGWHGDE
jgi:hypothetical protein